MPGAKLWNAAAPGLAVVWRRLPHWLQWAVMRLHSPAYMVGVSAVCLNRRGTALILEHRFADDENRWGLPGGLLQRGEDPEDGLRREIHEEIGLTVGHLTPLSVERHGRLLNLVYLCRVEQDPPRLQQAELTAWQWCDPATVDLPLRQHHLRALRLVAAGRSAAPKQG
jgi:8-oxo-dGTP diphosphatase